MSFLSSIYTFFGIALIALLAGAWGGYSYESAKFEAFRSQVEVNARVQQELTKRDAQEAQQVNTETVNAYTQTIAGIHAYYQSQRVLHPSTPSGKLPQIPFPASRTNGQTGDDLPAAFPTTFALTEACANTTAQLLALQDWIKAQGAIYGQ